MKEAVFWVGIDVGATSFHAAVDFPNISERQQEYAVADLENKEFKMTSGGTRAFLHWVASLQEAFLAEYAGENEYCCTNRFLMESTGPYSKKLELMIRKERPEAIVIICNPAPIKHYRTTLNVKNKTDKADAQVIARFGKERRPEPQKTRSPEMEKLCHFSRLRIFFKGLGTALSLSHNCCFDALGKRMCSAILKVVERQIEQLEKEMHKIVEKDTAIREEVGILSSMPGVGFTSAVAILGELGSLKSYPSRESITAASGLNPCQKRSGTSVNFTSISKQGSKLVRRILYMDSITSMQHIPSLAQFYQRILSRGKKPMQARCAVMRKILVILHAMVISNQYFKKNEEKNKKRD